MSYVIRWINGTARDLEAFARKRLEEQRPRVGTVDIFEIKDRFVDFKMRKLAIFEVMFRQII